jgi:Cu(I)/Ag(I) efflux system membrane fusion protein
MTIDDPQSDKVEPHKTPRRRFSFWAIVLVGILSALISGGAVFLLTRQTNSAEKEAISAKYHCPMHPSIIQDHPGNCPICGMKLVPMTQSSTPSKEHPPKAISFYRSPMDPKQTSPTPRKDEMGMDYIPVYNNEKSGESSEVPEMAAVGIDPEKQQLIGLTTIEVVRGPIGGLVRTVGRVAVDETRVRHVNVKNGGFVEHVYADYLGKHVKKGDPLFSMYSPELLAAQEEFLLALRTSNALGTTQDGSRTLVDAARRRLALWDVSPPAVRKLEEGGQPSKSLTFYSPAAGVVTKKDIVDGMKLDPGAMPYEIVDLSSVWVLASVYESELRFVTNGTPATLTLKAFPGRKFPGKVVFIDPFLDPQSRTVKVRIIAANPNGDLRPEMFGEVELHIASREALVVPTDAIIDSGTSKVVFIAQGSGKFSPRIIEVGQSTGGTTEVTKGLALGERIVTRANFLLDSESRLRSSLNDLSTGKPERARVLPITGTAGTP